MDILEDTDVDGKAGTDVVGVTGGCVGRDVTPEAGADVSETVMTSLVLCSIESSLSERSHVAAVDMNEGGGLAGESPIVMEVIVSEAGGLVVESPIVMEVVVSEEDSVNEESHVSVLMMRDFG